RHSQSRDLHLLPPAHAVSGHCLPMSKKVQVLQWVVRIVTGVAPDRSLSGYSGLGLEGRSGEVSGAFTPGAFRRDLARPSIRAISDLHGTCFRPGQERRWLTNGYRPGKGLEAFPVRDLARRSLRF